MNSRRFRLETPVLVAILIAWLGALSYLSSQRWLLDIAAEPQTDLLADESATLPGSHREVSVLRLTAFEPAPGHQDQGQPEDAWKGRRHGVAARDAWDGARSDGT